MRTTRTAVPTNLRMVVEDPSRHCHHHHLLQFGQNRSGLCKVSFLCHQEFLNCFFFLVRCFYYMFILTTDYRSTCLQRCIFAADGDWSQSLDTHQACLSRPGYAVSWNLGLLILVCNEIKQRGRYVFEKQMC